MFSGGKDPYKEKWEGARTSHDDVVMHFKADDAQPIAMFPSVLKSLASSSSYVYIDLPQPESPRRSRSMSHKFLLKVLRPHYITLKLRLRRF